MLSTFENARLERHLRACPSCATFAVGADAQTQLLRDAALEEPTLTLDLPRSPARTVRRASGVFAAVLTASVAAIAFFGVGPRNQSLPGVQPESAATGSPMIVVVSARSGPTSTSVEVPRLRVQSAAIADLPVHGKFNDPVAL
jgi:hypothetical protein